MLLTLHQKLHKPPVPGSVRTKNNHIPLQLIPPSKKDFTWALPTSFLNTNIYLTPAHIDTCLELYKRYSAIIITVTVAKAMETVMVMVTTVTLG